MDHPEKVDPPAVAESRLLPVPRRRLRKRAITGALGTLLVIGGVAAASAQSSGVHTLRSGEPGWLAKVGPGGTFLVDGDTISATDGRGTVRIQSDMWSTLGVTSPRVVPDGAGGVYYSTVAGEPTIDPEKPASEQGVTTGTSLGDPEVRHIDSSGTDTLVAHATGFAVRPDGAVAFTRGIDEHLLANEAYRSDIVVRLPGRDEIVVSPETATWEVRGWAGADLIVYRDLGGDAGGTFSLINTDTRKVRELPPGTPAAISDDTNRIVVVSGPMLPEAAPDDIVFQTVDRATGRIVAELPASAFTEAGAAMLSDQPGMWSGNTVVIPAEPGPVTVTLDNSGRPRVSKVQELDQGEAWIRQIAPSPDGTGYLMLVGANDYTDNAGALTARIVECQAATRCKTVVEKQPARRQVLSLAFNPSKGA